MKYTKLIADLNGKHKEWSSMIGDLKKFQGSNVYFSNLTAPASSLILAISCECKNLENAINLLNENNS